MNGRVAYLTGAVLLLAVAGISVAAVIEARGTDLPPVVFQAATDYRQYDIGVATADSSTLLTDDKLSYGPVWSPDGLQIAYFRGEPNSWEECCGYAEQRVWLMDADGANAHAVSDILESPGPLHWEPDGGSLLFTDEGQRVAELYRLDLASGAVSVALSPFKSRDFSLSPDGTQLVSGELEPRRIVIVDIDDGSREVVADDVFGYGNNVTWSPDGEWLVMAALARGVDDGGIWAWNLSDEEPLQVSATAGATYTWVGPDVLLSCRVIDVKAGDGYDTDGSVGLLYVNDLGDGGESKRVDGYDQQVVPYYPPGNCIGEAMDGQVIMP